MTGKERILKTLKGKPVDRVPIWLLDPFANDMVIDDWTEKWMTDDPLFIDLRDYYWENCELIFEYKTLSPFGICNRILATPPRYIRVKYEKYEGDTKIIVDDHTLDSRPPQVLGSFHQLILAFLTFQVLFHCLH